MSLAKFSKPFLYIKRYKQITQILLKYGFGCFLKKLKLHSMLPFNKRIMQLKLGKEIDFPATVLCLWPGIQDQCSYLVSLIISIFLTRTPSKKIIPSKRMINGETDASREMDR